jgi:signal transduction histidine kinase
LHDVVAYHMSLIAVRAESAPFQYPQIGEAARQVLQEISRDARGALDELRQVLVVLQRTERTAGAERAPQPSAADIASLVDEGRAAGQEVLFEWFGQAQVPAAQGYVLFRSAQEALTNARRHAPGAPAHLVVTVREFTVRMRASNPTAVQVPSQRAGRGLIGMRERVEALGGTLTASIHEGAFVIVAELPLAAGPFERTNPSQDVEPDAVANCSVTGERTESR